MKNSYLFVNGKEIFRFKTNNKNANFRTQFRLGSITNAFGALEYREVSKNTYFNSNEKSINVKICF